MSHDNISKGKLLPISKRNYKGKITFGDKEYNCEVRDGVRYIDGKTIDEFLYSLDEGYKKLLARKGEELLTGKKSIRN